MDQKRNWRYGENVESGRPPYQYTNQGYADTQMTAVGQQTMMVSAISHPGFHTNVSDPPPVYDSGFEDSGFSNASIRRAFIRKVYLTLMIQLLVTVGIICAFLYWETLRTWAQNTYWFTYGMMLATLVLSIIMSCSDTVRRKVPFNFIALGIFTIAEGLMLGSVAALFKAEPVLWAVGATALVSFSITLFAMQSKFDFTAMNGLLWVFLWSLISFGILCAIFRTQFAYIAYASLGTLLFSLYLVIDTQLILGGKNRKFEVSPEEYIFAALNLYLDIVLLFLMLLRIFAICSE